LYTVRVENLKKFCEFVNQEYEQISGYSKTRGHALLSAVERLVNMKSFFESQDKCPFVIKAFVEKSGQRLGYTLCIIKHQILMQ
jgi:hypothetical protein